ncbi:hypothetical protein Bbelb_385760 [Branchiostoma belcheri]|nr:hypothetical protein Bbelb_385760 [Branchiostoma belcheri]
MSGPERCGALRSSTETRDRMTVRTCPPAVSPCRANGLSITAIFPNARKWQPYTQGRVARPGGNDSATVALRLKVARRQSRCIRNDAAQQVITLDNGGCDRDCWQGQWGPSPNRSTYQVTRRSLCHLRPLISNPCMETDSEGHCHCETIPAFPKGRTPAVKFTGKSFLSYLKSAVARRISGILLPRDL